MATINIHLPGVFDFKIDFPEKWEDLQQIEVLAIAKAMLQPQTAQMEMLCFIINNRTKNLPADWIKLLDAEQAFNALPLLDFVYQTITLVKPAETKIGEMVAPSANFESITCAEFEDCEQYFFSFSETPSPEPLANIAAILYRSQGQPYTWLDAQKGLQTYKHDESAIEMLKLAEHRLYAIYLWYIGCRTALPNLFPTMHEPGENDKDETNPSMSFTKCIHAGAGPKNGTRDQIRMMKLFEFLYDMEQEAIKAKEMREFYANQK